MNYTVEFPAGSNYERATSADTSTTVGTESLTSQPTAPEPFTGAEAIYVGGGILTLMAAGVLMRGR